MKCCVKPLHIRDYLYGNDISGPTYLPLTTAYAAATGITDATILNACNELEKNLKGLPDASVNTTYDLIGDGNIAYMYINRGESEVGCETDFVQNFNRQIQNAPVINNKGVVWDGISAFATTGYVNSVELADERSGWMGLYYDIGGGSYGTGAAQDPNKYNALALSYSGNTRTGFYGSDDAGGVDPADDATNGVRGGFRISTTQRITQVKNIQTTINNNFGAHPALQDTQGGLNYNTNLNIIAFKAATEVTLSKIVGSMDALKMNALKDSFLQFAIDLGI